MWLQKQSRISLEGGYHQRSTWVESIWTFISNMFKNISEILIELHPLWNKGQKKKLERVCRREGLRGDRGVL